MRMSDRPTVVEAKPEQSFVWAVGNPQNAAATWRIDLVPEGTGTRVQHQVQLEPRPSGLTARIAELPVSRGRASCAMQRGSPSHRPSTCCHATQFGA